MNTDRSTLLPPETSSLDEQAIDDLAYELQEQTLAALRVRNPGGGLADAIEKNALSMAYRQKMIGLLQAMLRNAAESGHPLHEVLGMRNMLLRNHVAEPDLYLTPEHLAMRDRVFNTVLETLTNKRIERYKTNTAEAACCYVVTADPEDQLLLEHIVSERGVYDIAVMKSLLAEMKQHTSALSRGII